jgi:FlaA1/EpsC-like NDP-sugar epimerase
MWALRIIVKIIFDASSAKNESARAIIYGALTGGIGVAKNIRAQNPRQFELCGFITHDRRMRDLRLMGVPVYTQEDDIASIIDKENIQAVNEKIREKLLDLEKLLEEREKQEK